MRRTNPIALLLLLLLAALAPLTRAADPPARPFGLSSRTPWTTGRVTGSPEPPAPFRTERAYPNLTFKNPLDIAFAPGLADRVFVVEQGGKIFSFPLSDEQRTKPDLLIDISKVKGLDQIPDCRGTGDTYGLAFHPHFAQNHYAYVCYILNLKTPGRNHKDASRVSRFTVTISDTAPPTIDPASEKILLTWLSGGHNGGCLKFGPDGFLYISTGDGADPDPPDDMNTGQDISDLLSSILRIDVDHPGPNGKPYSIPADNPFLKTPGAAGEVFAYGLRNPWRMNFDSQTGNLWVADVGWELWESVFCCKPGTNCGWSIMEGPNPVHPAAPPGPTPITPPAVTLSHAESASITGGIVYHGKKLPELNGYYVFGDWQTQRLWAAKCNGDKLEPHREIAMTDQRIVAFGEQPADGEMLIADHQGGGLWRLVRNTVSAAAHPFPRKLSETGLFSSTKDQNPETGVIPFSINAPQWVDGASARRFIAVPGTEKVVWGKGVWGDDKPAWPKDSVLVRTLSLPMRDSKGAVADTPVETQLLHFDGRQWQAYTYAWNAEHTDADLIPAAGDERRFTVADPSADGGTRLQIWHFASRSQCLTCHNVWGDYALAFNPAQLDRDHKFEDSTDNEVRTFRHLGLLVEPKKGNDSGSKEKLTLTNPYDATGDLNERARSYLHVNCSECHRFGGGGSALFDVRKELPADKLNLINVKPNLGGFGLDDPRIICPGDPARSVMIYRMSKLGRGRMPHIGSDRVDEKGLALIREWTIALAAKTGTPPLDPTAAKNHAANSDALAALTKPADDPTAIDQLLSSPTGALALLSLIDEAKLPPATAATATKKGITHPNDAIRDLFRRFDPAEQTRSRLGQNIDPVRLLSLPGDPNRGRQIFFELSTTGLCARCHIVNGKGTDLGPDLSHIATKYNRQDLLDNILHPSKSIAPGYTTYLLETKSGDAYTGFLLSQSPAEIVLKDATFKQIKVPASDVKKLTPQAISAMPEGLLADLEPQQAADLLEYLATLK